MRPKRIQRSTRFSSQRSSTRVSALMTARRVWLRPAIHSARRLQQPRC
jgi:hypothetical protein